MYQVTNGTQEGYELSPDFAMSFVKERIKLYEYGSGDKVHRYDHCLIHEKNNQFFLYISMGQQMALWSRLRNVKAPTFGKSLKVVA